MGCGCTKPNFNSSKSSVVPHPVEAGKSQTDHGTPTSGKKTDNPPLKKSYTVIVKKDEILVRFDRRGEVLDYYSREFNRPGRLSDMRKAYSAVGCKASKDLQSPRLLLDYVYGYQCYASRNNLFYLQDEIVYPCGSLVVLLNRRENTQRYAGGGFLGQAVGHSDDVLALAINAQRDMVATGEVGVNPLVCVWRVADLAAPLHQFSLGEGAKGVAVLSFSLKSQLLACVDLSADQIVRVFELKKGELIYVEKGYLGHIYSIAFGPKDAFCSVGISHMFFWTKSGNSFSREKGQFGSDGNECAMSTVQWLASGLCITGGHNGKLYLWENGRMSRSHQILPNSQEIHALAVSTDMIVTGGQDCKLHMLDHSLRKLRVVEVSDWPRAIDIQGSNILFSTRDGVIAELNGSSQRIIMESHNEGEVWSIAQDCQRPNLLISTGDDNKMKVWDIHQRRCISTTIIEILAVKNTAHRSSLLPSSQQSRAISISPTGHVAVGHNDGHVTIRDSRELENVLFTLLDSRTWIRYLQYSPQGHFLASGNFAGQVSVYSAITEYVLVHSFEVYYESPVVSIDWCMDNSQLRVCSQDQSLRYLKLAEKDFFETTELGEDQWATWTSLIGQAVGGIVQMSDPQLVTAVNRSHSGALLAVGTAWGLLDLYPYPCVAGSLPRSYKAHSLEVANAVWTLNDEYLLTAGGHDLALMQWRVER